MKLFLQAFVVALLVYGLVCVFVFAGSEVYPTRVDARDVYIEFSTGNRKYLVRESAINMISFPMKPENGRTLLLVGSVRIETDWTEEDFENILEKLKNGH